MKHIIGGNPHAPLHQVKSLTIDDDAAGQRLDNFLMRHLKGVPKTHIYRIIRSGEIRVNKGRASAETRLNGGDVVRLPPVRVSERATEKAQAMAEQVASHAPAREFAILFEDDSLLAINKPAGVAVHGGSGVSFGVIEQLRMARPAAKFLELVHRLDRETSGILLVAKKRSALKNLQDQFRERETGKTYLALVLGQWPANKKVLDKPLHKYLLPDGERRVKVVTKDDPDGMPSLTLVKMRAQSGPAATEASASPTAGEVTRCWKLPSKPGAPTKFVSTWQVKECLLPGTINMVTLSATRPWPVLVHPLRSNACFCTHGGCNASTR